MSTETNGVLKYDPDQPRDDQGKWSSGEGGGSQASVAAPKKTGMPPEKLDKYGVNSEHVAVDHGLPADFYAIDDDSYSFGMTVNPKYLTPAFDKADKEWKESKAAKKMERTHAAREAELQDIVKNLRAKVASGEIKADNWITSNSAHILLGSDTHRRIFGGGKGDASKAPDGKDRRGSGDDRRKDKRPDAKAKPSKDDVEKALKRKGLPDAAKNKIREAHASGKLKSNAELLGEVNDAIQEAKEEYNRGKELAGKSEIMTDTLVNFGGEIKAVEETATGWNFGGYLVVFDSHDISSQRDKFTKSTDFDIEDGDRISLYYNHGLDGTVKRAKIGTGHLSVKDEGIWLEGEVKKRTDYLAKHAEKIGQGLSQKVAFKGQDHCLFGLSSGALSHLVEREAVQGGHEIKMWKIGEASITPTPAEPKTSCYSLKSYMEDDELKWDESQHNRDHGQFASGAGGSAEAKKPKVLPDHAVAALEDVRKDLAGADRAQGYETGYQKGKISDVALSIQTSLGLSMGSANKYASDMAHGEKTPIDKIMEGKPIRVSAVDSLGIRPSAMLDLGYRTGGKTDRYGNGTMYEFGDSSKKSYIEYEDEIKYSDFATQSEVEEATEAILRERMPLEWHTGAVRTAVKGLYERFEAVELLNVKAGRVMSSDTHSTFSDMCDSLEGITQGMREKLAIHAPESKDEEVKGVTPETMKAINAFIVRTAHTDYSKI